MTPSKVIRRLLEIAAANGPQIQEAAGVPREMGGCILMTAIGCDVLRQFGILADPFPVRIAAMNAQYVAWADAGYPGGIPDGKPDEAYCVADAGSGATFTTPARADGLQGHLAIHLPAQQQLLDLDARQLHKPHHGVDMASGVMLPWPAGTEEMVYELPRGGQLQIQHRPDQSRYRESVWWFEGTRAGIVPAIVRAIRKG